MISLVAAACSTPDDPPADTTEDTTGDPSTDTPDAAGPTSDTTGQLSTEPGRVFAMHHDVREAGGSAEVSSEVLHLESHHGRLFAALGQWTSRTGTGAPVLVKDGPDEPWSTFAITESNRVTVLESFTVPASHNRGTAVEVLVSAGTIDGRAQLMWWRDGATSFDGRTDIGVADVSVRALGARIEGDEFAFYAGVRPTGVLRGTWNAADGSIDWVLSAELQEPDPDDRKITAFVECAGAMWVTVRHRLYRRNDGPLPPGVPRWALAQEAPSPGADNSGLRGLTCIEHDGRPALLTSVEGPGTLVRVEDLPTGVIAQPTVVPVIEAEPRPLITAELRERGHSVPADGAGAVNYVIAAYNDLVALDASGGPVHVTGIEWSYARALCPEGRTCQPERPFDTEACYFVRELVGGTPRWDMGCLGGELTPTGPTEPPLTNGEAFVAMRTIRPSPWDPARAYVGGYDANFVFSRGTAWVGSVDIERLVEAAVEL